jgi:hypothetical protein
LYKGYLRIIFKLIISATLLALGLLAVLIIAIQLGSSTLNLPGFFGYMNIIQNAWLWITIAVFFTVSFLLFQNLLKSFLSCPPGDLIYNR